MTVHTPWDTSEWFGDGEVLHAADEDLTDENGDGYLDRQAGHGTFIAGIVRRVAPDVEIQVEGCLTSFGDGDDLSISRSIQEFRARLAGRSLDGVVINMSFSGAADARPPLLSAEIEALTAEGAVVVAAAGNDGRCAPTWPAAHRDVIGVGALDCAGRAWFSNFGPWVDAAAPAVDVVSTFFDGDFAADMVGGHDPDRFRGFARWSGTSFAAPKVAAAIADHMARTGCEARQAAEAVVRRSDLFRLPGLGTVVNR